MAAVAHAAAPVVIVVAILPFPFAQTVTTTTTIAAAVTTTTIAAAVIVAAAAVAAAAIAAVVATTITTNLSSYVSVCGVNFQFFQVWGVYTPCTPLNYVTVLALPQVANLGVTGACP